ncbi:MAG: PD40 domain-containing protein [Candidatus Latescibacterota bacterium]|nr:MAG: PD40 domain-containing protein [Candidatus Latescibacterota bacterium]
MKTASRNGRTYVILMIGLAALVGFSAGCSDDEGGVTDGDGGSTAITIEAIIFNPKSPAPFDTMRATAIVTSESPNVGDFVSYSWTASGGTFLETNKSSVRWVAPTTSSVYALTVKASNSVNTATATEDVFVGTLDDFITERAGELHYTASGDGLYYLSPPSDVESGVTVRFKDASSDVPVFPTEPAGEQYSFDLAATQAAHLSIVQIIRERLTVVHDDLLAGVQTTIARDERPVPIRPNEFSSPYVSPDGQLICYQGSLLDQTAPPSAGGVDTFSIYVYEIATQETQKVVFEGDVYGSFYPSFSSDNQRLVFVRNEIDDPTSWEYYTLPISGSTVTPDTVPGALVQISDSGGLMGSESVPPSDRSKAWNPNPAFPVMAVAAANGELWLIPADGGGAAVDIDGRITDGTWTTDGQTLAVSTFEGGDVNRSNIYLVTPGGNPTLLLQGEEGDRLENLSWSGDGEFIIYTVDRSGEVWYEVADVGGSSNLTKPARITPAWTPSADGAAAFGPPLMSLRSAWVPGTMTAVLFFLDRGTPRVMSIDLSGIAP